MVFFEKEEYTIEDIKSLIDNEAEESIHLEFKAAQALRKEDKARTEITKDVAAFANSDGGVIIYGVQEKEHKAEHITCIDGSVFTKEWLELIINDGIQRRIPGLKIYPIHKDGDIKQTVYVVKIPVSMEAPHINKDKLYYKRYNFQSVKMEEYEVRQLYLRKSHAKLEIEDVKIYIDFDEWGEVLQFPKVTIEVYAKNIGEVVEENYKTNITFHNFTENQPYGNDCIFRNQQKFHMTVNGEDTIISSPSPVSIYPNETICVFKAILQTEFFSHFENSCTYTVTLYYSNGTIECKGDFNNAS